MYKTNLTDLQQGLLCTVGFSACFLSNCRNVCFSGNSDHHHHRQRCHHHCHLHLHSRQHLHCHCCLHYHRFCPHLQHDVNIMSTVNVLTKYEQCSTFDFKWATSFIIFKYHPFHVFFLPFNIM